jgi:uncharacterized membrane protein
VTAHRQAIALLSLVGVFVSVYLWLHRIGVIGTLSCGVSGGCETVQTSPYAVMFGVPVPAYGVAGYGTLLGLSLLGLHPRWRGARGVTLALVCLATAGFGYTLYLTYLELFVIRAMCRWCVGSAVIMTAIWVVAVMELRKAGVGRRA